MAFIAQVPQLLDQYRLSVSPCSTGGVAPDQPLARRTAVQTAEALFAAKLPPNEKPVNQSALRPQVLPTAQPPVQPETIRAPADPQPPSPKAISAADLPRIRTWIKYGMTIAQVAAVYGADVGEIERVQRKT